LPGDLSAGYYESFKGNQFTSLRGVTIWWFVWSYFLYYFEIRDDELVIKHHNYFWVNRRYPLSDIREVVFETQHKWPNCLRVITTDFTTHLYPAGSLRDKHWLSLAKALAGHGITVRNECV
jgi:hypothetical protein